MTLNRSYSFYRSNEVIIYTQLGWQWQNKLKTTLRRYVCLIGELYLVIVSRECNIVQLL